MRAMEAEDGGIRLNKFLSEAGVCSRREADRKIEAGKVFVDGKCAVVGQRITPEADVVVDGQPVVVEKDRILLLFHKPKGIVCTAEKREKNNVIDYIGYPKRIFPIGRLDKDSRGLLLLTNQGDLVNAIMRARNYHEKEYIVRIKEEVTAELIEKLQGGVFLPELGGTTRKCDVKKKDVHTFSIVLTQGLNRQIRRMCEQSNVHVTDLKRIRIMNFRFDGIKEGTYPPATEAEWLTLEKALPMPR